MKYSNVVFVRALDFGGRLTSAETGAQIRSLQVVLNRFVPARTSG